jgi:hypothetical protein
MIYGTLEALRDGHDNTEVGHRGPVLPVFFHSDLI